MTLTSGVEEKSGVPKKKSDNNTAGSVKKSGVNKSLKRYLNIPIIS